MSDVLFELQQTYNAELSRMKKAITFMDGPALLAEKDKWMPEFKAIEKELDRLILDIEKAATIKMTKTEILEGF